MPAAAKGLSVIRILGLADGRPTPDDGRYVVSCDVDAYEGRGLVQSTDDVAEAMTFDGMADALEYWKRQSTVTPLRPDGKPNRPLTAYSVEIEWI